MAAGQQVDAVPKKSITILACQKVCGSALGNYKVVRGKVTVVQKCVMCENAQVCNIL